MDVEGQKAESSPAPLGNLFSGPNTQDSGRDESPTPTAVVEETKTVEVAAPATDKKPVEGVKVEGEHAKSEVKAEALPEGDKPKEEDKAIGDAKSTVDWESEDNFYKQKLAEAEKNQRETRNWATQLNQQNKRLQDQLGVINKKLDGTYDPEVDDPRPDPQAVILQAEAKGKMTGSLDAAYRQYGKETVDKDIARYNELFSENPYVQNQVWNSPAPVFAALKTLRDFDIAEKYKTSDVGDLIEKVKTEVRAELEKELTEKITKQLMTGIAMKKEAPTGINGARAATKVEGEKLETHKPLSAYFTN